MAQRHPVAAGRQPCNQFQTAVQLGSKRDDADVRRCTLDLPKDVSRLEWTFLSRPSSAARLLGPAVQRPTRTAQTVDRLRAVVLDVDEVALEMRRQNARAARPRLRP